MGLGRILRHLTTTRSSLERAFDPSTRRAIEEAIGATEATHRGEIRFAVEARLALRDLWAGETADERALDVFAELGVWDTELNSGILIYVLLADRVVAIVADRGYRDAVQPEGWRAVCDRMESSFRRGEFREGAVEGVSGAARYAVELFPLDGHDPGELPDSVVFL